MEDQKTVLLYFSLEQYFNHNMKKFLITTTILSLTTVALIYGENRKLKGTINNQNNTISGLLGEIKKLSYHLGKSKK